jgi:O-antigen/teichoic acid export membrane protein
MESILGLGFIGLLVIAIVWWLPVILILRSDKTDGGEKLVWILLIFFFSWFSWILYALLAPVGRQRA